MSERLDTLGDLLKIVEDLRDRADQAERLVLRLYIEQGDARIASTQSAVAYSAPVEMVSRATATHAVMVPSGAFCCDVPLDEP